MQTKRRHPKRRQPKRKTQRKTQRRQRQTQRQSKDELFKKHVPKKEIMSTHESNGNMIVGMRNLLEKIHLVQRKR